MDPQQLRYSKTHEWVSLSGDRPPLATIGITAFAVQQLTDLVYLQLPEVGRRVSAGESFGEVESVKAVSDLYSPVSGEVIEVNDSLTDHLEILTQDPFGAGWIAKIRVEDNGRLADLMDYSAYQRQCSEE